MVPSKRVPPWVCALINQAAFPGLGTILAGRRAGYGQAAIMITGFVLTMGFLIWYLVCVGRYAANPAWSEADFYAQYRPHQWSLRWGLGLCAVAWIWALWSSLTIVRAGNSSSIRRHCA